MKQIFRADTKRKRTTYDSYQLFLEDKSAPSRAWSTNEIKQLYEREWEVFKIMSYETQEENGIVQE
jgi:hypothetical protein